MNMQQEFARQLVVATEYKSFSALMDKMPSDGEDFVRAMYYGGRLQICVIENLVTYGYMPEDLIMLFTAADKDRDTFDKKCNKDMEKVRKGRGYHDIPSVIHGRCVECMQVTQSCNLVGLILRAFDINYGYLGTRVQKDAFAAMVVEYFVPKVEYEKEMSQLEEVKVF